MQKQTITVMIPARMASTRLPNKPLLDLAGLPMVVRVAQQVPAHFQVVVVCDDIKIVKACQAHHIQTLLTDVHHTSGSDRLAQACQLLNLPDDAIVVNVQGDEPLVPPCLIQATADALQHGKTPMSTAAHAITQADIADFNNPNVVKVVLNREKQAMYFSRSAIPFCREGGIEQTPLRHIGIYAYQAGFLRQFPQMPVAGVEQCEMLEQLRVLWHGHKIAVHVTDLAPPAGIDTPIDLERVRRFYAQQQIA